MEIERLIQEYTKKAKQLALRKSILCGVFFGFALDFVMALILCFVNVGVAMMLLLSLGVGLIGGIAAGTILYFMRFKPTTKSVVEMIDKLGLEERIVTMYEMEHEDSNIAQLQREDAKEKLSRVNPAMFRFRLPTAMLAALITVCVLGISMTTVSTLSAAGVFQPGNEIVGPIDPNNPDDPTEEEQTEYVEINYLASEGGTVQGETYQRIEKGKDATAVVAVADEGYSFAEWSDGVMTSERWDWNVMDNMTVTAIFLKNQTDSSAGEGEGEGEGEGSGEGQGEGEGGGESQGEGDGQGGQGENQGEGNGDGQGGESEGDPEGELQGGGGASASGQLDDNTVIDGKTDYSDAVDYETEKENVENDDTLPPDLKDALSGYLDGMKP